MSDAVLKLLPQVQALTDEEWLELCKRRDEAQIGVLSEDECDAAWLPILERRSHELRTGQVKGLTIEEFFASLDAKRAKRK
jgi:hypothetical protein